MCFLNLKTQTKTWSNVAQIYFFGFDPIDLRISAEKQSISTLDLSLFCCLLDNLFDVHNADPQDPKRQKNICCLIPELVQSQPSVDQF